MLKRIVVAGLAVSLVPACSLPDFDQQLENLPEIAPATPPQGCLEDADCVGIGPDGGDLTCIRHLDADEEVGLCQAEGVVGAQIGAGGGTEGGEGEGEGEEGEGEGPPVVPEICNDEDDDNDGTVDEGFALGESCDDLGVCKGGEWICHSGGGRICSVKPGQATSPAGDETCNRKDDDCDGAVDEGITLAGAEGAELPLGAHCAAKGECGGGIVVCYLPGSPNAGAPCCSSDSLCRGADPDAELCDGIDNDCDGSTDEGFDVGIECDGEEACGKGTTVCALDLSTSCCTTKGGCEPLEPQEDGPVGEDEVCDEVDNDCDGEADEELGLGDPCGEGACAAGTRICTPESGEVVCSTSGDAIDEICNGIDDDCDGVTDNGIERLGEECGQGVCGGGVYVCDLEEEDGPPTRCSTEGQAGDEVCNGLDDDCDGLVDEEIGKGALCAGVGECGVGVQECDGAGGLRCSTDIGGVHYPNVAEVCNGLDDDCDGELPANEGDTDQDGDLDCAEEAHEPACPAGALDDGTVGPSATELCDEIDNDCDGLVDEGFGLEDECGFGRCAGGETVCDPNDPTKLGVICDSFDEARPEICNGIDDDCDGTLPAWDEDLDEDEVRICDGDCDDGNGDIHPDADEICNGLDDDCDGEVPRVEIDLDDDGYVECASVVEGLMGGDCEPDDILSFPGAPERCDGVNNSCDPEYDAGRLEKDQDEDGWRACEDCNDDVALINPGLAERCDDNRDNDCNGLADDFDSAAEICDGFDNDCDGFTDENWSIGVQCAGLFGICSEFAGVFECTDDGSDRCSVDPGGSADASEEERCNGEDDDCDGETDEGCNDDGDEFCDLDFEVEEGATCIPGDCDDTRGTVYPADADELCDGLNTDCDADLDELDEGDDDGDGFLACDERAPDCDDDDPRVYPGAEEICDGKDNDCNNVTPAEELVDDDDDGVIVCFDCDDDNPDVPRPDLFEELSTGTDDDCAGGVDRLEDDFEGETLREGWSVFNGSAQIVDRQDDVGGRFLGLSPDGADDAIAQALAPVIAPAGFDVTVDLRLVDGNDNTFGGVMFGWEADGTFGYVALHPPNEVWLGTFTEGLADPVEDRYDEGIRNGGFGPVTLRVSGEADGRVRVWVDGVRILDGQDMSVLGRVGLFSKGTQVAFDNLQIRNP